MISDGLTGAEGRDRVETTLPATSGTHAATSRARLGPAVHVGHIGLESDYQVQARGGAVHDRARKVGRTGGSPTCDGSAAAGGTVPYTFFKALATKPVAPSKPLVRNADSELRREE